MQPDAVERALTEIIRGPGVTEAPERTVPALLARHDFPASVSARHAEDPERGRLLVYRTLVHSRFRSAIEASMPLAAKRIEALLSGEVAGFLAERAATSAYVRDIAPEFLRWALPRWKENPAIPKFVGEIAQHELLLLEVGAAMDDALAATARAASLSNALEFQRGARLVHYEYRVHEADDDNDPSPGPIDLLAYRDANHRVRALELSPLASALVTRLMRGESLQEATLGSIQDTGSQLSDALLASIASLLEDLETRGVILPTSEVVPPQ